LAIRSLAWHLRKRLYPAFTGAVAAVDFAGDNKLRGGDIFTSDPVYNAVDFDDFDLLAQHWYESIFDDPEHWAVGGAQADIDGNGQVDFDDFDILASNWYLEGDPE
jgi:hypothetical protein